MTHLEVLSSSNRVPTLVTWALPIGGRREDASALASRIPGAQLYEFTGRGHIPAGYHHR